MGIEIQSNMVVSGGKNRLKDINLKFAVDKESPLK